MLEKGAVEVVRDHSSPGLYHRLFTVPKASGGVLPVIDLSPLNILIQNPSFRMETAESIRASLQQGEWACHFDLKDAYLHIPMAKDLCKYLRFMVDGVVYQFRVLPFGLNQAPRIFTFFLRPVVAFLREHGQRLYAYLDNWMFRACWESRMPYITRVSILLLQDLGWLINWEKTNLLPRQILEFLGCEWNLAQALVFPAPSTSGTSNNGSGLAGLKREAVG